MLLFLIETKKINCKVYGVPGLPPRKNYLALLEAAYDGAGNLERQLCFCFVFI